ncbi:MAG: Mur ligase family protein [Spirochaetes bacterium]|jgi:dihydrofolate synthase/folylpolyglutamate synthase|nr:Mur ligase family protein [Spirochaetota bacterium]
MSFETSLKPYLNNEQSSGNFSRYSPDGIKAAASALQNPQNTYPVFHIAGTNGKGSVAHYLAEILIRSGYTTAVFTSPHLCTVHERIRINRKMIDDHTAVQIIDYIEQHCDTSALTWFDMLTLIAFEYFKRMKVDYAVIECGLGGRLDSTNICSQSDALITSISLDHTSILGNTLESITAEKAAIIKGGSVITTNRDERIIKIIEQYCKKAKAELLLPDRDYQSFCPENRTINVTVGDRLFEAIPFDSPSPVQRQNFAAALTLATTCGINLSVSILNETPFSPPHGRFELISSNPLVVYDCAHNSDAIAEMLLNITRSGYSKTTIFLSLMKDKNSEEILSQIKASGHRILYVTLSDERAWCPTESDNLTIVKPSEVASHISSDGSLNLFCGSFRLFPILADIIDKGFL